MARRTTLAYRWFLKCFSAVLAALVLLDIVLYCVFRMYFYNTVEQALRSELNIISTVITGYYSNSVNSAVSYDEQARTAVESFTKKDLMELMVINSDGEVIITSSGFEPPGEYTMPDYEAAKQSEDGIASYSGYQAGGEKVMAVTELLQTGSGDFTAARVVTSLEKADYQLGIVMVVVVLISAAVILLILTLGLYFIRSIVIPLRQIGANAQKIAQGDFKVSIKYKTDDELGELVKVFNYMAGELENTEKLKNDFTSSVSHELRTPLTAIKGWSETIAQSLDDRQTVKKGMRIISDETARLSDMVEELLDFSRIQSGRFNLSKENMDIFAELTDAVIMYSQKAQIDGKTILYSEPEAVVTIYGDRNRIRQVFVNIIDNALKYTGDGGVVRIETLVAPGKVKICVEDNGCGIAREDLPKVKGMYYKANNNVRGSGIGLAVADEIVSAHGGTLEIKSEEGQYTRVEITLPVAKKEE